MKPLCGAQFFFVCIEFQLNNHHNDFFSHSWLLHKDLFIHLINRFFNYSIEIALIANALSAICHLRYFF